eukprot:3758589-Pyramimonas_sp.AAC.1
MSAGSEPRVSGDSPGPQELGPASGRRSWVELSSSRSTACGACSGQVLPGITSASHCSHAV